MPKLKLPRLNRHINKHHLACYGKMHDILNLYREWYPTKVNSNDYIIKWSFGRGFINYDECLLMCELNKQLRGEL